MPAESTSSSKQQVAVLAIDGGGIRGVIPAMILGEIESRTGSRASDLFDLVAGTSTGGILALGLTKPGKNGRSAYSAEDLVAIYEDEGRTIFDRPLWHRFIAVENLLEEKFPADGLEDVLNRYFGRSLLSEATTEILVTAYELETRQPWFFARHKARDPKRKGWDFQMREVARATSAAPTYFEPYELKSTRPPGALIDGGIFANNPAMCAWVEARKLYPDARDTIVVSLGTGQNTRPIHYRDARTWGLAKWAQPAFTCVFDGVSDTVDHQMAVLCDAPDRGRRYFRFQTELDSAMDDMDNATRTNVLALERKAAEIIATRSSDIDAVCELLVARARGTAAARNGRGPTAGNGRAAAHLLPPRSVQPDDFVPSEDEFDPFADHLLDRPPRREGDDSIHADTARVY
jgi:predicted acylesterase/phospholipase RssA